MRVKSLISSAAVGAMMKFVEFFLIICKIFFSRKNFLLKVCTY